MNDNDINAVSIEVDNDDDCVKIHKLIDINEISSQHNSPVIAAIKQCQPNLAAKRVWSGYPFKPKCQAEFESSVAKAVSQIAEDNPYLSVQAGEIDAISAMNFKPGSYGLDIRFLIIYIQGKMRSGSIEKPRYKRSS